MRPCVHAAVAVRQPQVQTSTRTDADTDTNTDTNTDTDTDTDTDTSTETHRHSADLSRKVPGEAAGIDESEKDPETEGVVHCDGAIDL
jgi:hypothetical protein